MTSQGHVTTVSLKQANKEDYRRAFFMCLHQKFDNDQTSSNRLINRSFGVEECWSYINNGGVM